MPLFQGGLLDGEGSFFGHGGKIAACLHCAIPLRDPGERKSWFEGVTRRVIEITQIEGLASGLGLGLDLQPTHHGKLFCVIEISLSRA